MRGRGATPAARRGDAPETLLEHAARGERARIARELHDVVAHHISIIARAGRDRPADHPGHAAEGAERLVAIGDTARTALTEMRRLLGVLREDAETGEPTRRPQPGCDQLSDAASTSVRDDRAGGARLIVHAGGSRRSTRASS